MIGQKLMVSKKISEDEPVVEEKLHSPRFGKWRLKGKKAQTPSSDTNSSSLASGAFIVLIVLIVVTAFSLTLTTKSSQDIEVVGPTGITVNVDLTSSVFREAYNNSSTPEYCNSPKQYKGISSSSLFLSDGNSKSLGTVKLGDAIGFNYTSCKFRAFLPLNDSFAGGKVSVYVKFPFGESETFLLDIGNQKPFKIDLRLNLG